MMDKGYDPAERVIVIGTSPYQQEFGVRAVPECGGGFIDPHNKEVTEMLKDYLR